MKSTVEEIRRRFDADVERFSDLETGQSATIDAPLAMSLVAEAAACTTPHARDLLDIGCGAGNYALKLLEHLPNLNVTLIDLSRPMLQRASERLTAAHAAAVSLIQGDIRQIKLPDAGFDVILAAAVLHHLRTEDEWRAVFASLHRALRGGGSVWIFDLVDSTSAPVRQMMRRRYAQYLTNLKGPEYCEQVLAYVEKEDSPRPLMFQLERLREVGFENVDVLHKNACFAAFGAVKS